MTFLRLRPLATSPALWLVRWALAAPMAYHGLWNLGAEGAAWWDGAASALPGGLRFVVGAAELLAALALASGVLVRLAAIGLVPLMLGAVAQHLDAGFSFKHGGWETPVVYCALALAIALDRGRPPT